MTLRNSAGGGNPTADRLAVHQRPRRATTLEGQAELFLLAEQDRVIVKETQRFTAERMKAKVRRHPVDHMPSVTAPGVVVDITLEVLHDAH